MVRLNCHKLSRQLTNIRIAPICSSRRATEKARLEARVPRSKVVPFSLSLRAKMEEGHPGSACTCRFQTLGKLLRSKAAVVSVAGRYGPRR